MIAGEKLGEFVSDAAGGAGDEDGHEDILAGGTGSAKKSKAPLLAKDARNGAPSLYLGQALSVDQFYSVDRVPTGGGFQFVVDVVDVLDAFGFEPRAEGGCAMLGVNWDAIFPGGAAAEDAVELHAGLSGEFEGLAELCVADAGRQVNERLGGDG